MKKKYKLTNSEMAVLYEFDESGNIAFTDKNIVWGHLKINQEIDFNRLKEALNFSLKKNDAIRIKLYKENDKILQYFEDYEEQDIEIVDVDTEEDVQKLKNKIINKPFEIFDSFLFNIVLYRYENEYGGIIIKLNHVIGDGYTLGLLLYEVLGYYSKAIKRIPSVSYLDYIKSEEKYQFTIKYKRDKKYWNKMFENGVPDSAYFPSKKKNYSFSKTNELAFDIDNDIVEIVKSFCDRNKISNSTFYMSVFSIYIHKITNLTRFFIAVANRNRKSVKEMLMAGMRTKTAYLIAEVKNEKFLDYAKKIRISLKSSYKHMDYLYNYQDELFQQYNVNRPIPSKVFISYQNLQVDTNKININFEIEGDNNPGTYGTDLVPIHVFEHNDNVRIIYDYLLEKYSEKEIAAINNSIIDIIKQIGKDDNIYIDDIKI